MSDRPVYIFIDIWRRDENGNIETLLRKCWETSEEMYVEQEVRERLENENRI